MDDRHRRHPIETPLSYPPGDTQNTMAQAGGGGACCGAVARRRRFGARGPPGVRRAAGSGASTPCLRPTCRRPVRRPFAAPASEAPRSPSRPWPLLWFGPGSTRARPRRRPRRYGPCCAGCGAPPALLSLYGMHAGSPLSAGSRARARGTVDPLVQADPSFDKPRATPALSCSICQDDCTFGDRISRLQRSHLFNLQCFDTWVATQTSNRQVPACPHCRQPVEVAAQEYFVRPEPVVSPPAPDASSQYSSAISETVLPWWPVPGTRLPVGAYHMATQLPDDSLSVIIDPGGRSNLIGEKLARALSRGPSAEAQVPSVSGVGLLSSALLEPGKKQLCAPLAARLSYPLDAPKR